MSLVTRCGKVLLVGGKVTTTKKCCCNRCCALDLIYPKTLTATITFTGDCMTDRFDSGTGTAVVQGPQDDCHPENTSTRILDVQVSGGSHGECPAIIWEFNMLLECIYSNETGYGSPDCIFDGYWSFIARCPVEDPDVSYGWFDSAAGVCGSVEGAGVVVTCNPFHYTATILGFDPGSGTTGPVQPETACCPQLPGDDEGTGHITYYPVGVLCHGGMILDIS